MKASSHSGFFFPLVISSLQSTDLTTVFRTFQMKDGKCVQVLCSGTIHQTGHSGGLLCCLWSVLSSLPPYPHPQRPLIEGPPPAAA